ncbi:Aldo/keto reductase [Atractiella rhizophila]|nr:Aldo/keto reductase [Atractiella rhizophila]
MAVSKSAIPVIIGAAKFGTGDIAMIKSVQEVDRLFSWSVERGYSFVDTGAMYPSPPDSGSSERLIGQSQHLDKLTISLKAFSLRPLAHNAENLRESIEGSLERLGVKKVKIFMLQTPEPGKVTSVEETLSTVDALHKEGKFEQFGLSNFALEDLEEFVNVSKKNNYVPISVYEGQYNILSRNPEEKLLPFLRNHNIGFWAFSPSAGGFLSGKWLTNRNQAGRFAGDNGMAAISRMWYFKDALFTAVTRFLDFLKKDHPDLQGIEVALRWIAHHSPLKKENGDAIMIGGSRVEHWQKNIEFLEKGPLPSDVVDQVEQLWDQVKDVAIDYDSDLSKMGAGPPPAQ